MDSNELIRGKGWWAKRKWYLLAVIVMFILIIIVFVNGIKTFGSFGKAYADKALFDNAIDIVEKDSVANALIGNVVPVDNMAIANGTIDYSDVDSTVTATIPIKGSLKKAKLDIIAKKVDGMWEYKTVKIRTKDPKQEIDVLANQD